MSTCNRQGSNYKRHDYRKNTEKCSRCGHDKPRPKAQRES